MPYPTATDEQIAFFREHGCLVVEDAIDPDDLARSRSTATTIIEQQARRWPSTGPGTRDEPTRGALVQDRAVVPVAGLARASTTRRSGRGPSSSAPRSWGSRVEFWYDQFLGKPPHNDAPTYWHQDEGYWGRNLDDKGITCWIPLQDVDDDATAACTSSTAATATACSSTSQRRGRAERPARAASPTRRRTVACPITLRQRDVPPLQDAAHDHGQRLRPLAQGGHPAHAGRRSAGGEGDHYPWKIYVNQFTGETRRARAAMTGGARSRGRLDDGGRAGLERCTMRGRAPLACGAPSVVSTGSTEAIALVLERAGSGHRHRARQVRPHRRQGGRDASPARARRPCFVHAADALHGDAGMVSDGDVLIAISNSGETRRGVRLRRAGRSARRPGHRDHRLRRRRRPSPSWPTCRLDAGVDRECDPHDLAPTASTTVDAGARRRPRRGR